MAKNHGAKQQKKLAKQKAKRQEKRASLARRHSLDPTVRLSRADRWPVVRALVSDTTWREGMGHAVIARQETEGQLIYAVLLLDVYCLGVKDAFWRVGSRHDFHELIERMEERASMEPMEPACFVKLVQGAVDFAQSLGFPPHEDFRHASMLLAGIDPAGCTREFTFGKDGKPFYIQGPHETPERAMAISERVKQAGGNYVAFLGPAPPPELFHDDPGLINSLEDEFDEQEEDEPGKDEPEKDEPEA